MKCYGFLCDRPKLGHDPHEMTEADIADPVEFAERLKRRDEALQYIEEPVAEPVGQ